MMKKKSRGVIIRDWDRKLFSYLLSSKVALIEQIERDLPKKYSTRHSLVVRLWRLRKHGFLSAQYSNLNKGEKVICLTKKSFDLFLSNGNETKRQLKSDKVEHDLGLVDIHHYLKKAKKVSWTLTENDLHTWPGYRDNEKTRAFVELNSDGIVEVEFPNGKFLLALEYEANDKGRARYRELFQNYYAYEEVVAVLYVCKDDHIMKKVMSEEAEFIGNERRSFLYKTIEELKQDKTMTFTDGLGEKIILGEESDA